MGTLRAIIEASLRFRLLDSRCRRGGTRRRSEPAALDAGETCFRSFSPTVEVQTEALGLSAQEVEQLITTPLEQDLLNGVAFLDSIRSESVPGLSRIEMIFEPGTEVVAARQVVNERLTQAHALPNVSKPPQMMQSMSSMSRVLMVRVSFDDQSLMELACSADGRSAPS